MSLSDEEALFDDIFDNDTAPVKTEDKVDKKEESSEKKDVSDETKPSSSSADEAQDSTAVADASETDSKATSTGNATSIPADDSQLKSEEKQSVSSSSESVPAAAPPPSAPQHDEATATPTPELSAEETRKADLSRDAGKMFIGGLDWDTSEESMKEYFSQFGEVIDHTIMRETSTGRSRGFGFLTFADSKSVDKVVRQQHVLDGKVIDPKRAIPREEQDKTGKIFVGGLPPDVRPHEFEAYFAKFGSIIDAQLMLDKDTGRSRGFGFVTFDSPDSVDRATQHRFIDFNGKQIEVKRAEPRGIQQQQNHQQQQHQRQFQQVQGGSMGNMGAAMGGMNMGMMAGMFQQQQQMQASPEALSAYIVQLEQYWEQVKQTQQVTPEMTAQFQQYVDAIKQQATSGAPSNPPTGPASYGSDFGRPANADRGSGAKGGRGGRGRGRGGYNNKGGFHPYNRN
ncbi:Nuclear polyadenylated RNA-binding protein 4 [Cyberlindnera fabianii]|uniref:Nuclear polyadenylated RNA-binding protein 4 n=1 Tax=Cyberlindnera fabianii TaxID=36022 RepID=A0A1V2LDF7_CYBFA|nr:Nuclear polyadenylated RNA-binding protein 4 [Cyberlindnera fabianii]